MATPRAQLIDPENALTYHLVSRCVRRSWLCGTDPHTNRNYDHRKAWLETRLLKLASAFAIDLFGYAIMSNHFHLIVRYDPTAAATWSDEQVVDRWLDSCAALNPEDDEFEYKKELARLAFMSNPIKLNKIRATLGSLSSFMKHLKQPIAWRANREDSCTGHFFEGRFFSGALLDEAAYTSALAYVDLNPVRAKMVRRAVEGTHTSLRKRLQALASDDRKLQEYLAPVVSGLNRNKETKPETLNITLAGYLDYLEQFSLNDDSPIDEEANWFQRVAMFKRRQRAYGKETALKIWTAERGWSRTGMPLA